ncbi:MAG: sulfur oxidation c-type cytochrome SoxX [Rhizobiales bacterium PAR1]|nr:MAG: sulfur oxidation c-type cytochrome SoxX [Rhizobiales bacterium PAR1]
MGAKTRAFGLAAILLLALASSGVMVRGQGITELVVAGEIPRPLNGLTGDAARGRTIITDRRKGLCLLCHSGPFPEERFQGTLAPTLAGTGKRLTEGAIRLRLVDGRKLNQQTLMPPYHATEGLSQVGQNWRDKTIFSAQDVEDVVAFLKTLQE